MTKAGTQATRAARDENFMATRFVCLSNDERTWRHRLLFYRFDDSKTKTSSQGTTYETLNDADSSAIDVELWVVLHPLIEEQLS